MNLPEFSPGEGATNEPESPLSPEQSEEASRRYPVLLVLGGGFKREPASPPALTSESHMRILAAGEMFKQGMIGKIVLAGGKTAGDDNPSEAQVMKAYLQKKYPRISDENIILEENSVDTSENMENINRLLEERGFNEAILLTSELHLKRAEQLARQYNLNIIEGHAAEDEIINRSPRHYERFVDNYTASCGYKMAQVKEFILRSLLVVDRGGKIPRFLAHQTRGR